MFSIIDGQRSFENEFSDNIYTSRKDLKKKKKNSEPYSLQKKKNLTARSGQLS